MPLPLTVDIAGRITLDMFRGKLFAMGVEETAEARRLLQQTPLSFAQLLKALMSDSSSLADVPAGARRDFVRAMRKESGQ